MSFLRSIFQRPDYTSETTDFIRQMKDSRPALDDEQRAGRALLWDKQVDRRLWAEYGAGKVAQKAYVYQTDAT